MLLVIGGIKGGSGKTTIATNLAVCFARLGLKTLLVDADEQKSATSWAEQRENYYTEVMISKKKASPTSFMDAEEIKSFDFPTISLGGKFMYQQLQRLKEDYEIIIVDTGGRDTTTQRAALTVADKFLVPFKPRSLDVWTLGDVKRLIDEIHSINPLLSCYYLINQGDSRGSDNEDAMEIISELDCLKMVPQVIGYRKAFSNAAAEGLSVWEIDKRDGKACLEMWNCASYIYYKDINEMPF